jgi:CheY-like chemotaxis protein
VTDISAVPRSAPSTKILLVEDSDANRDMLTRRLERRGFQVRGAADGPSGVAMAASEIPDLILMDVALGAMDGWEATRRIKADPRTANIPIIALTAHALATDRDKSVEVGCSDFDTKPVDLLRLLGKIEKCLAKKKIMDSRPNPAAELPPAPQSASPARPVALPVSAPVVGASPDADSALALTGSMRDFRELRGKDLIARVGNFYEWQRLRRNQGLWPYSKATE